MVRVGGGWETLAAYFSRIDPCRAPMDSFGRHGGGGGVTAGRAKRFESNESLESPTRPTPQPSQPVERVESAPQLEEEEDVEEDGAPQVTMENVAPVEAVVPTTAPVKPKRPSVNRRPPSPAQRAPSPTKGGRPSSPLKPTKSVPRESATSPRPTSKGPSIEPRQTKASLLRTSSPGALQKKPLSASQSIDVVLPVQALASECTCSVPFKVNRVSEGRYQVGEGRSMVFVRVLRSHVMVRVGGGWETLAAYFSRIDPCRAPMDSFGRHGGGGGVTAGRAKRFESNESLESPTRPTPQPSQPVERVESAPQLEEEEDVEEDGAPQVTMENVAPVEAVVPTTAPVKPKRPSVNRRPPSPAQRAPSPTKGGRPSSPLKPTKSVPRESATSPRPTSKGPSIEPRQTKASLLRTSSPGALQKKPLSASQSIDGRPPWKFVPSNPSPSLVSPTKPASRSAGEIGASTPNFHGPSRFSTLDRKEPPTETKRLVPVGGKNLAKSDRYNRATQSVAGKPKITSPELIRRAMDIMQENGEDIKKEEVVRKPSTSALEAAIGELAAEEVQCEGQEIVDVDEAPDSGVGTGLDVTLAAVEDLEDIEELPRDHDINIQVGIEPVTENSAPADAAGPDIMTSFDNGGGGSCSTEDELNEAVRARDNAPSPAGAAIGDITPGAEAAMGDITPGVEATIGDITRTESPGEVDGSVVSDATFTKEAAGDDAGNVSVGDHGSIGEVDLVESFGGTVTPTPRAPAGSSWVPDLQVNAPTALLPDTIVAECATLPNLLQMLDSPRSAASSNKANPDWSQLELSELKAMTAQQTAAVSHLMEMVSKQGETVELLKQLALPRQQQQLLEQLPRKQELLEQLPQQQKLLEQLPQQQQLSEQLPHQLSEQLPQQQMEDLCVGMEDVKTTATAAPPLRSHHLHEATETGGIDSSTHDGTESAKEGVLSATKSQLIPDENQLLLTSLKDALPSDFEATIEALVELSELTSPEPRTPPIQDPGNDQLSRDQFSSPGCDELCRDQFSPKPQTPPVPTSREELSPGGEKGTKEDKLQAPSEDGETNLSQLHQGHSDTTTDVQGTSVPVEIGENVWPGVQVSIPISPGRVGKMSQQLSQPEQPTAPPSTPTVIDLGRERSSAGVSEPNEDISDTDTDDPVPSLIRRRSRFDIPMVPEHESARPTYQLTPPVSPGRVGKLTEQLERSASNASNSPSAPNEEGEPDVAQPHRWGGVPVLPIGENVWPGVQVTIPVSPGRVGKVKSQLTQPPEEIPDDYTQPESRGVVRSKSFPGKLTEPSIVEHESARPIYQLSPPVSPGRVGKLTEQLERSASAGPLERSPSLRSVGRLDKSLERVWSAPDRTTSTRGGGGRGSSGGLQRSHSTPPARGSSTPARGSYTPAPLPIQSADTNYPDRVHGSQLMEELEVDAVSPGPIECEMMRQVNRAPSAKRVNPVREELKPEHAQPRPAPSSPKGSHKMIVNYLFFLLHKTLFFHPRLFDKN
eukprot:sb/3460874/